VSIGAFERQPGGVPLSEQTLTLKEALHTPDAMLGALRENARAKLERILTVEPRVFDELLPETMAGQPGAGTALRADGVTKQS